MRVNCFGNFGRRPRTETRGRRGRSLTTEDTSNLRFAEFTEFHGGVEKNNCINYCFSRSITEKKIMESGKINCYGCGALVDDIEGKPHNYIGAVQGCWNLYGQILSKEYYEYNYPELTHRLTVDTYAIQHPGQLSKQSIQSVNIHLISLYLILCKNFSGKVVTKILGEIIAKKPKFEWIEAPVPNGTKTIIDVLAANGKEEHETKVREWAENVWDFWYKKHGKTIEKIVKLTVTVICS